MVGYTENIDAVVQNLEDAGCDKDTVAQFMELGRSGKKQGQVILLEKHRRTLLDKVHKREKQIDCLDYLLYQIRKENQQKTVQKKFICLLAGCYIRMLRYQYLCEENY